MGTTRSLKTGPSCSHTGAVQREDLVTKCRSSSGSERFRRVPYFHSLLPVILCYWLRFKRRKKWLKNLSDFQDTTSRIFKKIKQIKIIMMMRMRMMMRKGSKHWLTICLCRQCRRLCFRRFYSDITLQDSLPLSDNPLSSQI